MKEVKIYNSNTIAAERFKKGIATEVNLFEGSRKDVLNSTKPKAMLPRTIVKMGAENWEGSEGYVKLWGEINDLSDAYNAAQAPAQADIDALVQKVFIDITRRAQEAPDLTTLIAIEETNPGFPKSLTLEDFLKYIGKFAEIAGTNDSVPLIEQNLGNVRTVVMKIAGLGWKDSLANELFNSVHSLQKVLQAVTDAYTDYRNSKTVGVIVGATYVATQQQAADTTSGASFDYLMYETFRKAVKKLRGLKNILNARKVAVPSISVLCNSADTWDIERVIRGQLTTAGAEGNITSANLQSLPIDNIIEYDQGITQGFSWGKKTIDDFAGVTAGKAYIFVPREYFWVLKKAGLTQETGKGSALQLSTEERAWYTIQTEYYDIFLGSSLAGTAIGAGYGAIVELVLPS